MTSLGQLADSDPSHLTQLADNSALQPLFDVLSYVSRPTATERGEYVSAINCLKEIALQQMILTKKQYGKENGYIAWHGYQSFKPNEITPEKAHEIGLQTKDLCRIPKDVDFTEKDGHTEYEVVGHFNSDGEEFILNTVIRKLGYKFYDET